MSFSDRYDARRVSGVYDFNALFPYIMKKRNESIVFFSEILDVEPVLDYIKQKKSEGIDVTFFQTVLLGLIKVFNERPALNRYVIGRRIYQKDAVDISFAAKREFSDDASETNVNIRVKKEDKFEDILHKISGNIKAAKKGEEKEDDKLISVFMRLPRFFLRTVLRLIEWYDFYFDTPKFLRGIDPLRCSAYVANLGSVGIEAPYHHLYEWGTCSVFIAIGKIKLMPYVNEDGSVTSRKMVEIKLSLDERIADGFYCARSIDLFEYYMKNPKLLEKVGVVEDEEAMA